MQGHSLSEHEDPTLLPVSLTMSILAVLAAVVGLFGHRAHTRTLFEQNLSVSQWVSYEAVLAGRTSYDAILDFLPAAQLKDPSHERQLEQTYQQKIGQLAERQNSAKAKAEALDREVEHDEHVADRFDVGDGCLEGGLVIVSITLLTKRRVYWAIGLALALIGLAAAGTGFFM